MKVRTETTFEDNFDELERMLRELDGYEISAGFYDSKPHTDPRTGKVHETIPQIAFWLEYGTRHSPERPFMTIGLLTYEKNLLRQVGMVVSDVLRGKNPNIKSRFKRIADNLKKNIKQTIDSGTANFEKNSDTTLTLKAPETRLFYHTGQMVNALESRVEKDKDD